MSKSTAYASASTPTFLKPMPPSTKIAMKRTASMVGNTSTGIPTPGLSRPGTQPHVLVAAPRVSCALASVTTALDTVQTHNIQPTVVPDLTHFAMVTVQVFTSSIPTTVVTSPNVANVITTPVIAPTAPSAGTQLKPDETPKVSVMVTAAQPPISVPKPEVVAVTQPQPIPPPESSTLGNQIVGPPVTTGHSSTRSTYNSGQNNHTT